MHRWLIPKIICVKGCWLSTEINLQLITNAELWLFLILGGRVGLNLAIILPSKVNKIAKKDQDLALCTFPD